MVYLDFSTGIHDSSEPENSVQRRYVVDHYRVQSLQEGLKTDVD